MNKNNIDALQIILGNEVIMASLRKLFDETITDSLPDITTEPDKVIGEQYRAYHTSKYIIGEAFKRLESYRKPSKIGDIDNRHI